MVLGHAVELTGQVVVVAGRRQAHLVGQGVGGQAPVQAADGLVPEELDGVAIARHPGGDLGGARDWRAVGTHQMLCPQGEDVVDPGQQDLGVAVFLAADGEDVEQGRPDQVLDAGSKLGEPEGDAVVGVGGGVVDLHRQPGQGQALAAPKDVRGRNITGGEGGVLGVAEVQAQARVDRSVGAFGGQAQTELVNQAPGIGRADLAGGAGQVQGNALMPQYGQVGTTRIRQGRRRATDVMEVAVEYRRQGGGGVGPHLGQGRAHLLHALAGVDGDQAFRPLEEGLVGQAIAHQGPDPRPHRVQPALQPGGVIDVALVRPLAEGPRADLCRIGVETAHVHLPQGDYSPGCRVARPPEGFKSQFTAIRRLGGMAGARFARQSRPATSAFASARRSGGRGLLSGGRGGPGRGLPG